MKHVQIDGPLVEAAWLKERLKAGHLIVLDATLPKAVATTTASELSNKCIPGARFFDIKNVFSDASATYPNTWPGSDTFIKAAKNLGINKNSVIVVYDEHGIYSSVRAYWMFKAMGHTNVAVLNGGLPAWIAAGYPLEEKTEKTYVQGDFNGVLNPNYFKNHRDVLSNLEKQEAVVVDARAEDRFKGLVDEPRPGLRSGHIPGALNLPYTALLNKGKLRRVEELKSLMAKVSSSDKHLIFSCGSGITACVLALGAEVAGYKNLSVYDGSWTEWGSMTDLPIEKESNN